MKQIPCKHCGAPTHMLGTKMCHSCWELDRRVHNNPDIAAQILVSLGFEVNAPRTHHKPHCKLFPDPCDERDHVGPCTCGAKS